MAASAITTLTEIVDWLRSKWDTSEGARGPACQRVVRVHPFTLSPRIAVVAVLMYRWPGRNPGGWTDVPQLLARHRLTGPDKSFRGGDYAKLKHWQMTEQYHHAKTGKPVAGIYRLTPKGVRFARNEIAVASKIFVYNDDLLAVDDAALVYVRDVLARSSYAYDELTR